ncbi:MAG: hypothetical protein V3V08_15280 [Nannocystaceae bacterium]
MHRLAELVRLHRMGHNTREVALLLQMSPNTERRYRYALAAARLVDGSTDDLPTLEAIREALGTQLPCKAMSRHKSSVAAWSSVAGSPSLGPRCKAGAEVSAGPATRLSTIARPFR